MRVKKLFDGLENKYLLFTVFTPLVMIGEVVMETIIPLVMAHIIDDGIANNDISYVIRTGFLMIVFTFISLLCGVLGGRFASVASYGFSKNLRLLLFRKIENYSSGQIEKIGTPSLVTRLTTDITNVQNMFHNLIRSMVRAPLMMIFGTVMACFINVKLAVIFFISIPVLATLLILIASRAYPLFKDMFEKYDLLNTVVQENLIAIRVVKAFVRGEFETQKFSEAAAKVRDAQVRAEKIVIINAPIMKFVIYMCIIATLWFGGNMVLSQTMKTGELVSYLTYVTQILMSLMMLSMMFVQFILSRASVNRILEIIETDSTENENSADEDADKQTVKNGDIEFDSVYFSYEQKKENCVLSDIKLKIKSGQIVGITGGTGSSKTTLVSLIPRIYDVLEGCVKVGGIDVKDYPYKALRKQIGFVPQKSVLFSGTIQENLLWGNENASLDLMVDACKIAQAHDFIMSFPEGYKTNLGQGGVNLSGGQKQRLCLARALLKNPMILILDDSTSALDTATDLKVRTSLKEKLTQTTKIIISQRIASIQDCDLIIVLDDGKISGSGSHDELLKNNPIYKEIYDSQMSKN